MIKDMLITPSSSQAVNSKSEVAWTVGGVSRSKCTWHPLSVAALPIPHFLTVPLSIGYSPNLLSYISTIHKAIKCRSHYCLMITAALYCHWVVLHLALNMSSRCLLQTFPPFCHLSRYLRPRPVAVMQPAMMINGGNASGHIFPY